MEVLIPGYLQSISRIFAFHEKKFHTIELDKTFFYNISMKYVHAMEESDFSGVSST